MCIALRVVLTVGYKLQAHNLYPDIPPYQAWTGWTWSAASSAGHQCRPAAAPPTGLQGVAQRGQRQTTKIKTKFIHTA